MESLHASNMQHRACGGGRAAAGDRRASLSGP